MRRRLRKHTRDRVWRMGSENPTANIPVVVVDVVPAGPLRRRCRWAHVLGWSQIEVERVEGARRWVRRCYRRANGQQRWSRGGGRRLLRMVWRRRGVGSRGQQLGHRRVRGRAPLLERLVIPDVRVQVRRRGRRSNREKESEGIRGNQRISRIECLFCSLLSPIPYATSI